MPRQTVEKSYFQFAQGKITEASPLTFPENSMKDVLNMDIQPEGGVNRRRGLNWEDNWAATAEPAGGGVTQTFVWYNAKNLQSLSPILVVRRGTRLVFHSLYAEPASGTKFPQVYDVPGAAHEPWDFIEAKGSLVIVRPSSHPVLFTPNTSGTSYSIRPIIIRIRDLEGVEDGTNPSKRPASLSGAHHYNLINQGWPWRKTPWKVEPGAKPHDAVNGAAYQFFLSGTRPDGPRKRAYPSNSDRPWDFFSETSIVPYFLVQIGEHKGLAPKGKVVIDAFAENRRFLSEEYSELNTDQTLVNPPPVNVTPWLPSNFQERSTNKRPSTAAFFQGHLLYSGVDDPEYSDKIYVSQSITDNDSFGNCYAINDPTADIESSPLDTDGGVITIGGSGGIQWLEALRDRVLVFARNGIWEIRGGDGIFTMSDYSVSKISSLAIISPLSVCTYESSIIFWANEGIFSVSMGADSLSPTIENLTQQTIHKDYIRIPDTAKSKALAIPNPTDKRIMWLYQEDSPLVRAYNKMLILDVGTGAFYTHEFATQPGFPYVLGAFVKPALVKSTVDLDVVAGSDSVVAGADNVIVSTQETQSTGDGAVVKFISYSGNNTYSFAELRDRSFKDWKGWNDTEGLNYESFVETGYELGGDAMRDKQATYIFCYFNRTEDGFQTTDTGLQLRNPSSCFLQGQWDWTGTGSANRWSGKQQVYRFRRAYIPTGGADPFDYDFEVIETKNKVRGKGKALSLRFESEEGKDFQLLGWAIQYTAEGQV